MKKLNWDGFLIVLALCTISGISNNNFTILIGAIFGFLLGLIFATIILLEPLIN